MPKKIYISGPMTGWHNNNVESFNAVAAQLRAAGHQVVNPAELNDPQATYAQAMRTDIAALLTCESICMLPGWQSSRGANLERDIAGVIGLEILYVKLEIE
jgi:hypothetical protein